MRQRGVLTEWNDERGFGYVTPGEGGRRAFVHVSAFPRGRRPVDGCEVTYVEVRDERNRPRASAVQYVNRQPKQQSGAAKTPLALAIASAFFALLVGFVILDRLPLLVVAAYAALSLTSFAVYEADKSAAQRGEWRISESTLHTVDMLGGWPGGLIARHAFRHKTTKEPFRTIFWSTAMVNCAVLGWWVAVQPPLMP